MGQVSDCRFDVKLIASVARRYNCPMRTSLGIFVVVPGHGVVTTKQEMAKFRESTLRLRNSVYEMLVQKKSCDVSKMLQAEFTGPSLHLDRGLDGLMGPWTPVA